MTYHKGEERQTRRLGYKDVEWILKTLNETHRISTMEHASFSPEIKKEIRLFVKSYWEEPTGELIDYIRKKTGLDKENPNKERE